MFFPLTTFQWSSKALITQHFSNITSWSFDCKRSCFVVPWICEVWFPTALCFCYHHHHNPRLPACPLWSSQLVRDSLCCGLSSLWLSLPKSPVCQPSRSALTSARTDAQSSCINHLCLGNQTRAFLPPLPPQKNKPRLNVSVTFHKGVLCFQWAPLLRCQAVRARWQMENPTQSSLDLPLYKSKWVDLIFPLQRILLLMDSQFCNPLHYALGFKCVSTPFPWQ